MLKIEFSRASVDVSPTIKLISGDFNTSYVTVQPKRQHREQH